MQILRAGSVSMALALPLAACGSDETSATDGAADVGPSMQSMDPCYREDAGELTVTSLDLADPRVARWVQLVPGRHEVPLYWEALYLTDALRGLDEGTILSMEATVVDVIETEFVPAPASACEYRLDYHLNAELRLETADGALVGSLPALMNLSNEPFSAFATATAPLDGLAGTLELDPDPGLGVDPNAELSRTLRVFVSIHEDGQYASLQPNVSWRLPDGEWHDEGWSPGRAVTELMRCPGTRVHFDGTTPALEGEARLAADRLARLWPTAPIAARWNGGVSSTELTLRLGAPTLACLDRGDVRLLAPLDVSTADGAIQATYELATYLPAGGGEVGGSAGGLYIPVQDFERLAGVHGVDYRNASFARVDLHIQAPSESAFAGGVRVSGDSYSGGGFEYPELSWCVGEDCQ